MQQGAASISRGRAYGFSFSLFSIALTALQISWTWDESMANKVLMRWISAFTHWAFSSAFISCPHLVIRDVFQGFFLDMLDLHFPDFAKLGVQQRQ